MLAALIRRIELVIVATTLVVAIAAALLSDREPMLRFSHRFSRIMRFEGDEVDIDFTIHAASVIPLAEVVDLLPPRGSLVDGSNNVLVSL